MNNNADIIGYAAMLMQKFENLCIDGGLLNNMPIGAPPGLVGYIPVYATLEELRAAHGEDAFFLSIRKAEEVNT